MSDLAAPAALMLAATFAWAGVAKLREQAVTTSSFSGLGLPVASVMAKVVPGVELAVAIGLVAIPAVAAWPALVLLLVFSVVVARAVVAGSTVPCSCFGMGAASAEDARPVSVVELVRNAGLGALAIVASGAGAGTALRPSLPALVIVTVVAALARVAFAAAELRRLGGHVFTTPLPGEARR